MPARITIGEMAKLHAVSTQTLRYYDRIDLFKPSYKNEQTGYRYYGIEQFAHLESILFLKGMGMSLQEIKVYFKNRELGSMLNLLQTRMERIDSEIALLTLKRKKLASLLDTVANYLDRDTLGKCRLRQMPERRLLSFLFGRDDPFTEHELGIKKLEHAVQSVDDLYLNPFGTVISEENLRAGNYEVFKGIAMVLDRDFRAPDYAPAQVLSAGTYATMAFIGTYKDMAPACAQLTDWIGRQGGGICGDGIVLVITDKAYSDFAYEYISEIQIPVKIL